MRGQQRRRVLWARLRPDLERFVNPATGNMTIRALAQFEVWGVSYQPGSLYYLNAQHAAALIAGGLAEPVGDARVPTAGTLEQPPATVRDVLREISKLAPGG